MGGLDGGSACGFVAVMGVTRSGMSVHSGMLHKLGVPMGKDEHLDTGRYEDRCFVKLNRRAVEFTKTTLTTRLRVSVRHEYEDFIRAHANPPLWGLKDPAFHEIWPIFDEALHEVFSDVKVGIVVVHRRFRSIVQSIIRRHEESLKRGKPDFDDLDWSHTVTPMQAINRAVREFSRLLQVIDGMRYPVLHVEYEKALENPDQTVRELADFTGLGTGKIEQATSIVSSELRHF